MSTASFAYQMVPKMFRILQHLKCILHRAAEAHHSELSRCSPEIVELPLPDQKMLAKAYAGAKTAHQLYHLDSRPIQILFICRTTYIYMCVCVCKYIYIYCDYPGLWTQKNEHVAWYVREFMVALEDFDHCVSIDHLAQQCSIDPRNCKSRGPWCFKKVECNWVFPSFRSSVHETPGDSKDLEGFSGWRI